MTTIAYRAGVLAADSCMRVLGHYAGTAKKLIRLTDGSWLGMSGYHEDGELVANWLNAGAVAETRPRLSDEAGVLHVRLDGTAAHYEQLCHAIPMLDAFWAGGTGAPFAIGAMAAGASAEEAVRIACQYDVYSREPVEVVRVGAPAGDGYAFHDWYCSGCHDKRSPRDADRSPCIACGAPGEHRYVGMPQTPRQPPRRPIEPSCPSWNGV